MNDLRQDPPWNRCSRGSSPFYMKYAERWMTFWSKVRSGRVKFHSMWIGWWKIEGAQENQCSVQARKGTDGMLGQHGPKPSPGSWGTPSVRLGHSFFQEGRKNEAFEAWHDEEVYTLPGFQDIICWKWLHGLSFRRQFKTNIRLLRGIGGYHWMVCCRLLGCFLLIVNRGTVWVC